MEEEGKKMGREGMSSKKTKKGGGEKTRFGAQARKEKGKSTIDQSLVRRVGGMLKKICGHQGRRGEGERWAAEHQMEGVPQVAWVSGRGEAMGMT